MKKKIDKWFQHEGLDRSHMLLVMLCESFGEEKYHPSIWNKRCKKELRKATKAIANLYQAIGEWEDES